MSHGAEGNWLTGFSRVKNSSNNPERKINIGFVEPLGIFRVFRAAAVYTIARLQSVPRQFRMDGTVPLLMGWGTPGSGIVLIAG